MSLQDVKIRTKLTLAFSLFIVLMIFTASLSLLSLHKANNGMHDIITEDYPTTIKANQLIENFQDFINVQQMMLLDDRGKFREASEKRLTELSARITALLDGLSKAQNDERSRRVLDEITAVRKEYLDSRFRILQAVQLNDRAAALEEMTTTTLQIQEKYKAKVQALIAIQNERMNIAGAEVAKDYRANRALLILITLLSIVLAATAGWLIVRSITRPLGQAVEFAQAIAEGDLTRSIDIHRRDETGVLLHALMAMKVRLQEIVREVQQGSENISTAAAQIVAGNHDLAARTEEQASSVEETAASMEQITATVKNTYDHTNVATQLSADTASVVKKNGQMMSQVTSKMRLINDTSNRMSDIINLIDSIAFQTNILALNAAVEAARAGEHGRGFAVVAGEVRQLAQKSASSASEIRSLIENSTSQTREGMDLVQTANQQITGMVGNVDEMNGILSEIKQASLEQTEGISQINTAIGMIDTTTQQNSCLVEESVAAAASLNEQAQHLREMVRVFRLEQTAAGQYA
ncbi:methyl-accepting chemotaxis protein [Dryocola sp. BD613]|uniref:methyl-accepting chemotaxis protein n=1 Tax=Dryocola sp. BD613 TaxID=3133272 RepID=UPI003F509D3B